MGSRLWIISEEISISMLTKPNTQMPIGIRLREDALSFMVGILSVVVTVIRSCRLVDCASYWLRDATDLRHPYFRSLQPLDVAVGAARLQD